jgi:hypothetical protein
VGLPRDAVKREIHGMTRYLLLLLLLALSGCGRTDATGLSDERFIEVVVALRTAADDTRGDPSGYEARRTVILREAGVSEDELRAYVGRHSRDLHHMAEIWEAINERLTREGESEELLE